MNSQKHNLPQSDKLNVSALSQLFDSTATSYKYLFFNSILDILARRLFDNSTEISFRELMIEMLANAWYPHTFFKLSFGKKDKIADKLDSLELNISEPILKFTDKDKQLLRQTITQNNLNSIISDFKKNVPFRLIRPFLKEVLNQYDVNYEVVKHTAEVAKKYFNIYKPLYCFNSDDYKNSNAIFIHEEWIEYFQQNYVIIKGWLAWEWLQYMQKNNQNVPNLANKLFALQKRESLTKQTQYWKIILENKPIKCIYSGILLDKNSISLDHYLPWSFVAHDQLWNLIPTTSSVNSSKSNNIPSNKYLDQLIQLQHLGLTISYHHLSYNKWLKSVESFLADLRINQVEDLLNLEILTKAYQQTFNPLISLATIQGFIPNWTFEKV